MFEIPRKLAGAEQPSSVAPPGQNASIYVVCAIQPFFYDNGAL